MILGGASADSDGDWGGHHHPPSPFRDGETEARELGCLAQLSAAAARGYHGGQQGEHPNLSRPHPRLCGPSL